MKLSGFFFLFFCGCLFSSVAPPAAAAPQRVSPGDPRTDSPVQVSAAAGADGILPCRLPPTAGSAGVWTVEWTRVDGPSPVTVHVARDGEELVKEKAADYVRRTVLLEDGSLKLLGVRPPDSGTYRCLQVRGPSVELVFVSLSVAQMSEVHLSVQRSSDNQLFVLCESSGWSPEPLVSLLDSGGRVLAARTESSVRADGLFDVSARADVAAAGGSGPVVCRVEIPALGLANEKQLHITDDFHQEGLGGLLLLAVAFVVVCVIAVIVVFVVPLWTIEKLRSARQRLTAFCMTMILRDKEGQDDQPLLEGNQRKVSSLQPQGALHPPVAVSSPGWTDYGDISKVETSGASEVGAKANGVNATGVHASYMLAERHLTEMNKYRETIVSVGNSLRISPALIAAMISRQSWAGTSLGKNGCGRFDPESFGLMQISKRYHAVRGEPFSEEHVGQGVSILIQSIITMRTKSDWTKEQQLKGALACYVSGEGQVLPLDYDQLDSVTPNGDFANDVVARAHWFLENGF